MTNEESRVVRIVNLDDSYTEETLKQFILIHCQPQGSIEKIYLRGDDVLNTFYGYVIFEHSYDALKVTQNLNGHIDKLKKLEVELIGPNLSYRKYRGLGLFGPKRIGLNIASSKFIKTGENSDRLRVSNRVSNAKTAAGENSALAGPSKYFRPHKRDIPINGIGSTIPKQNHAAASGVSRKVEIPKYMSTQKQANRMNPDGVLTLPLGDRISKFRLHAAAGENSAGSTYVRPKQKFIPIEGICSTIPKQNHAAASGVSRKVEIPKYVPTQKQANRINPDDALTLPLGDRISKFRLHAAAGENSAGSTYVRPKQKFIPIEGICSTIPKQNHAAASGVSRKVEIPKYVPTQKQANRINPDDALTLPLGDRISKFRLHAAAGENSATAGPSKYFRPHKRNIPINSIGSTTIKQNRDDSACLLM